MIIVYQGQSLSLELLIFCQYSANCGGIGPFLQGVLQDFDRFRCVSEVVQGNGVDIGVAQGFRGQRVRFFDGLKAFFPAFRPNQQ